MRLRRRLTALEERIAALEAVTPIDYTMPPRYDIELSPAAPVAEFKPYDGAPLPDEDEPWDTRTGMYL